jgi:hypothetical protein
MAILADWIKQTVTGTPGTGAITLGSAVSGYIRLADDTRITNGALVYYTIEDGVNRERGIGTYSTTGPTLTRTVIHAKLTAGTYSENPGTGLSLTSAAIVSCSAVANAFNKHGALVYNATAITMTANAVWTDITWSHEAYDTLAFHETGSNTARLKVPAGVTKIRLIGNGEFSAMVAGGSRGLRIVKNGSAPAAGTSQAFFPNVTTAGTYTLGVSTPILNVVPDDYFTMQYWQSSGVTTGTLGANGTDGSVTYFAIEVLE